MRAGLPCECNSTPEAKRGARHHCRLRCPSVEALEEVDFPTSIRKCRCRYARMKKSFWNYAKMPARLSAGRQVHPLEE